MVEMQIDTKSTSLSTVDDTQSVPTSQNSSPPSCESSLSPSPASSSIPPSNKTEQPSDSSHVQSTKEKQTQEKNLKSEKPFYMKEQATKFRPIQENIYKGDIRRYMRRRQTLHAPDQCKCIQNGEMCGPDSHCINRDLFIECDPQSCPCGDHCRNCRIQKQAYAQIEVFRTQGMKRGLGVRTLQDLEPGDLVIEYIGEVVSQEELEQRFRLHARPGNRNYYSMKLERHLVVDAANKGNISRFINHACDPNCVVQKWDVLGVPRIGIFADDYIPANTELTYNYKFQVTGLAAQKCLCGCKNCTGWIGDPSESQTEAYSDSDVPHHAMVRRSCRRRLSSHPGKLVDAPSAGSKVRATGQKELQKRKGSAIARSLSSSSKSPEKLKPEERHEENGFQSDNKLSSAEGRQELRSGRRSLLGKLRLS